MLCSIGEIYMTAFWAAFLVVFLAEMGDKTQFVVMAFAAKYDWKAVFFGMSVGIILVHSLAVAVGSFIGDFIPTNLMAIIASLIFLGFGVWTLRSINADDEEEAEEEVHNSRYGAFFTVMMTFILGEMGDKTQFATMTMAAQYESWLFVLLGAVIGMILADCLGLLLGTFLHNHLPERQMKYLSGGIFLLFGVIGLAEAFL